MFKESNSLGQLNSSCLQSRAQREAHHFSAHRSWGEDRRADSIGCAHALVHLLASNVKILNVPLAFWLIFWTHKQVITRQSTNDNNSLSARLPRLKLLIPQCEGSNLPKPTFSVGSGSVATACKHRADRIQMCTWSFPTIYSYVVTFAVYLSPAKET